MHLLSWPRLLSSSVKPHHIFPAPDRFPGNTFSFSFISKVFAFNLQISEFSANTSSTASDFIPITLWKNLSVFPLHFPFFFHHSYFFLFTHSKLTDKIILLKVIVYPILLQTRFSLIISYCLTNSNFTAWFKSSNQKYFSQTYPSQFLLLHKNSYKTSFLKSYSFAIDNITLYL